MYTNAILAKKAPKELKPTKIHEILNTHYKTLAEQIQGVAENRWHLVVNGPTGSGKTEYVKTVLSKTAKGKITTNSGTLSAVKLFELLYHSRNEHDILVIDDTDSIFESTEAVEILKGALDSQGNKSVEWSKYSIALGRAGVPTSFVFNGRIIIVTNKVIERDPNLVRNKKDRSLLPLWSRVMYFAAGLPTRLWEVESIKMFHAAGQIKCFAEKGIDAKGQKAIIKFVQEYAEDLNDVNFRMISQCADLYNAFEDTWEHHALTSLAS
jgi:tRNA A37 threonylcarbamoyladenosine biosynthesis protein TsaE